jgi:hypothetical protein
VFHLFLRLTKLEEDEENDSTAGSWVRAEGEKRVMRLSSSWRFTGSASLLTTTILLYLGVCLLSWPAGGSEVSAVLAVADAPFAEQSSDSDGYPIDGTYLAMFAAEGEDGEKLPKNAALIKRLRQ